MRYGYAMHSKHKFSKELKRNLRFDDAEETLVIDIRLPGRTKWITVRHDRALRDQRDAQKREDSEVEDSALSTGPETEPSQAGGGTSSAAASSASSRDMDTSEEPLRNREQPQQTYNYSWNK